MKKSIIVVILLLSLAAGVTAQQPPPKPPPGAVDFVKGQLALRKRNTDGAIESFEKAIQANSDLILSHYYLGYAYQRKQDWERTGASFENFLQSLDRDDPLGTELAFYATRQGGLALARTTRFRLAIAYLDEVVAAEPEDDQALFFLGVALMKNNRKEEAVKRFNKVIELDKAFSEAYYHLGQIYFEQQDNVRARERLEEFVRLDPSSSHVAEAYFLLGSVALMEAEAAANPTQARARAKNHFEQCIRFGRSGDWVEKAKDVLKSLESTGGQNQGGL